MPNLNCLGNSVWKQNFSAKTTSLVNNNNLNVYLVESKCIEVLQTCVSYINKLPCFFDFQKEVILTLEPPLPPLGVPLNAI